MKRVYKLISGPLPGRIGHGSGFEEPRGGNSGGRQPFTGTDADPTVQVEAKMARYSQAI